jgi:hypothetical protein
LPLERRKEYAEWSSKDIKFDARIVEAWSFADGKRNMDEISNALTTSQLIPFSSGLIFTNL